MSSSDILLYRRRFIPDEKKPLTDDKILYMDENIILTSWNTLKPRSDFASGISAYFRKEGLKSAATTVWTAVSLAGTAILSWNPRKTMR